MKATEERILSLPTKSSETKNIKSHQSILLVGANGSGKTRLGTWIEMQSPQSKLVHRISAQKSLAMPDSTTPVSIELAEKDLLFGYADAPLGSEHGRLQELSATRLLN